MRIVLWSVLSLGLCLAPLSARPIENWSYERLFKEADLVVLATAQQTVNSAATASDPRWQRDLVGQETTFEVLQTLKGSSDEKTLTVLHFKLKEGVLVEYGPLLIRFRTQGPAFETTGSVKLRVALSTPQYLLFLKRTGTKTLEPLSGQIDPALSIKELYDPLPQELNSRRDQ
jgi:hypothetical protein